MRHQPGLAFAVAELLAPVRLHRRAMVMPDERRRRESDLPASCLQPPAHIHIVAGTQVNGIEPVNREQRVAAERHVAAGDVLGGAIVEQDVRRPARRARDALRHRRIVGRHDVRPARSDDVGVEERLDEKRQPVAIDARIGVGVRDDLSGRFREADVARGAQAAVRNVDHANAGVALADLPGAILGTVVDEDDLEIGVGQLLQRDEAVLERIGGVVSADDHRHARPRAPPLVGERRVGERRSNRSGCRLHLAIAIDEAEVPVGDRMTAAPPLVGPRERDRAARAFLERDAHVRRRDRGLPVLALANAVRARFREEQRLLSGDVLQPREVGAQIRLVVQVDVERADVEEREIEEFSRREVDVGEEAVRCRSLGVLVEAAQEPFDAHPAVPADDAWRNLVAEREHQHRRVIAELLHPGGDVAADRPLQLVVVEKRDVLRPGQADHHAQAVPRGFVEQVAPRRRVGADRIDPEARHQAEVLGDAGQWRELIAVGVGRERPVGDAFDQKAVVTGSVGTCRARTAQKLPVGRNANGGSQRDIVTDLGVCLKCSAHSGRPRRSSAFGQTRQLLLYQSVVGSVGDADVAAERLDA